MPRKRLSDDPFGDLTWDNLDEWAGSAVVSRGKTYQRQGRVSELATTGGGGLIVWVRGSETYATKIEPDRHRLRQSICTCPYEYDCKHGVSIVFECPECIKSDRRAPRAHRDDERFELKRTFYEIECIRGNWSVRELKRQIGSLYHERSGLPKDKSKLGALVHVQYALAVMDNGLFVSKYQLELPKKEELQRFIEEQVRETGS